MEYDVANDLHVPSNVHAPVDASGGDQTIEQTIEQEPRFARGTEEIARAPSAARDAEQSGLRAVDVAQIVHDLKTPLATIALEACLLDDRLAGDEHVEVRRALGRITHNVEYLDRIIEDLLDSCAFDEGRFELRQTAIELGSVVARVIERTVATRDRARVVLEATEPVTLLVDELRIERVIANLLSNALKYAPRSAIIVRLEVARHSARLWVVDSGPGLSADEMSFVFDKYRRAETVQGLTGNGLGLYVSRKIIDSHGGRIGVDSVEGEGARFFFDLPLP